MERLYVYGKIAIQLTSVGLAHTHPACLLTTYTYRHMSLLTRDHGVIVRP